MGFSYHYEFAAPATTSAAALESFLFSVEQFTQSLGFRPTHVLNAVFDTPERRHFSRRLGGSVRFQDERLKDASLVADGQIRDLIPMTGECVLIPQCGVVLIVTDERGCETRFGFFQFPDEILDLRGHVISSASMKGAWAFRNFVDSSDVRYRKIVARFVQASFVRRILDEFV